MMGRKQVVLLMLGMVLVLRFRHQQSHLNLQSEQLNNLHILEVVPKKNPLELTVKAPSSLHKQDKEDIVRQCPDCIHQTCESVPISTLDECRINPMLPKCNIKCLEGIPVNTSQYDHASSKNSLLWPPLGMGQWIAQTDSSICASRVNTTQPCLWDRYQWSLNGIGLPTKSHHELCHFLYSKQVSYIRIVGDSLVRHLFQTIVMILSGNPRESFRMGDDCVGTALFSETTCRIQQSPFVMNVCQDVIDKSIRVEFSKHYFDTPQWNVDDSSRTITIYGAGNHPANKKQQQDALATILNATAYIRHRWKPSQLADWIIKRPTEYQQKHVLLWIPVHSKYRIWKSVETNARAVDYMMETADFWSRYNVSTINTFTMTEQIVGKLCAKCPTFAKCQYFDREMCRPTLETYDGFHYGPQVNYWKAHLIFYRLQQLL